MAEEYLFAITLDSTRPIEVWDPEHKNEDADGMNQNFGADQKLIIKTVLLGPDAKPGEANVLEIEAMGLKGSVKTPIAVLQIDNVSQRNVKLHFSDPVTFSLQGSGPLHVVGQILLGTHMEEFDDMEDEMEEENIDDEDDEKDAEDEDDEDDEPKKKNAKLTTPNKYKSQVNKNKKK